MDREQQERLREAVDRKAEDAERKGREGNPHAGGQPPGPARDAEGQERELIATDRRPDDLSPRDKSTGHGKKTADKWNR
jgi:hypothetical protein